MKKIILTLAILGASLCHAQIDKSKYDEVGKFYNGFASIKLNGKYGFMNKEGKMVIPFKYDYAEDFSEGFAKVKEDGKWYIIDTKGKKIKEAEAELPPPPISRQM